MNNLFKTIVSLFFALFCVTATSAADNEFLFDTSFELPSLGEPFLLADANDAKEKITADSKDKSHGSVLPDKRKIRYYAAAGVSHVKSEDLRESINAGKEMCVEGPGDDFDCDFNSDSHDLGHRIILGFEVPLENGSIVDVSVFFQDGITIRGDDRFSAATMGGPFCIDSTSKQEIKTYGIDFSFLYKLTRNFFLGGGFGYHFFDIVDESNVVTQLKGEDVILSSVASRDSEHESVVAATAKLRYNLGKRIFLGGDLSRTLEEVGFNDDDHVTSVNAHVGVRF